MDPAVTSDGATPCERSYEQVLRVQKGAFVVQDAEYLGSDAGTQAFLDMVRQAAGPSLLPKHKGKEPGEMSTISTTTTTTTTVSFQGERRLVRLVIFRYFLGRAIRRFLNQEAKTMAAIATGEAVVTME